MVPWIYATDSAAPVAPFDNKSPKRLPDRYTVYSYSTIQTKEFMMDAQEWVARCSARLHAKWPRLHQDMREEVAADLWNDTRWQQMEPEIAVVEWLRQGVGAHQRGVAP